MATDPLDLWPEGLQANPLTPLKILTLQADRLRERTQGLLTAEIISSEKPADGNVWEAVHRFEIVAPRLSNYRHQLFVCRHNTDLVYPVWIVDPGSHHLKKEEAEAATQDEFIQVVRKILGSMHSRSLVNSLLARIAEFDGAATPA